MNPQLSASVSGSIRNHPRQATHESIRNYPQPQREESATAHNDSSTGRIDNNHSSVSNSFGDNVRAERA
jgi:hypothetical protein